MINTRTKNLNDAISIVIVTYNSANNIIALLKSINHAGQTPVKEVIIIENNSPDRSLTTRRINSYIKKSLAINIQYIQSNNNDGFAKSCNRGAKIATGQYILFLNPDTELKQNSIKILLEHALVNRVDIIGGLALNQNNKPHNPAVRAPNIFTGLFEFTNLGKLFHNDLAHKHFYYEDIQILNAKVDIQVDAVSGAYLLIHRLSYKKLNGFDERFFMYLEDVDLGVRANMANMKVVFCPHSVIFHEGGASSKNKYNIHHQAWFNSRKKYYLKHFNFLTNLLIQPIFHVEEFILKKTTP